MEADSGYTTGPAGGSEPSRDREKKLKVSLKCVSVCYINHNEDKCPQDN